MTQGMQELQAMAEMPEMDEMPDMNSMQERPDVGEVEENPGMPSSSNLIAKCKLCGAGLSNNGCIEGGSSQCNHQFVAMVIYPTPKENHWIRMIIQNKSENISHHGKFEQDLQELMQKKEQALEDTIAHFKKVRGMVDARETAMLDGIRQQFAAREAAIEGNMASLVHHRKQNDETKESAESLLQGSGNPNAQGREAVIVGSCQTIMNTTPDIKYIDTEFRCTFRSLDELHQKIDNFGQIHTRPIGCGRKCEFKSQSDAVVGEHAPAKKISLPMLRISKTAYDDEQKEMKVVFRLLFEQKNESKQLDALCLQHLRVKMMCESGGDDDDEKAGYDDAHSEVIPLDRCLTVQTKNGSNYVLSFKKIFAPGTNVNIRIQPCFVSPDDKKYKSGEGVLSASQTHKVELEKSVKFAVELQSDQKKEQQTVSIVESSKALTDFVAFEQKILDSFGIAFDDGQRLVLTVLGQLLNASTNLKELAASAQPISAKLVKTPKKMTRFMWVEKNGKEGEKKRLTIKRENGYSVAALKKCLSDKLRISIADLGLNAQVKFKLGNGQVIDIPDENDDVVKYFEVSESELAFVV